MGRHVVSKRRVSIILMAPSDEDASTLMGTRFVIILVGGSSMSESSDQSCTARRGINETDLKIYKSIRITSNRSVHHKSINQKSSHR
jgi:hypothetical protein